jgi:hypothetical protein
MPRPIGDIYLKKVRTLFCENANPKIAEPVKKHLSKQRQPTCHHYGVIGHIRPYYH